MFPRRSTFRYLRSLPLAVVLCFLGLACDSTTGSGGSAGTGGTAKGGVVGIGGFAGSGGNNAVGQSGDGGGTLGPAGVGGSTRGAATGGVVGAAGFSSGGRTSGDSRSGGVVGSGGAGSGGSTAGGGGSLSDGGAGPTGGATGGLTATGDKVDGGLDVAGTGGSSATGGKTGDGGNGSGGSVPTGGSAAMGGSGGANAGGLAATGGKAGSGGATATSGATGSGGSPGSGGAAGAGGSGVGSTLCPSGITQTITVAKDGSGQFTTVQAAVNSITSGSSTHIRIDIKAGTYTEKLTIASRTNLCLVGAGNTSTILSYGDSNASVGSTSGSASVLISANDFSAANLAIQNTYGSGSQAVALRTTGQRQQFLDCRFVGYQDTLYTHSGMQYFRNCYVQGNTDYVFGGATAVFQDCEARNVEGGSAVTAPNTDIGTAYGIVFFGGQFTAVSSVKSGSVALGRPWGADGFAAFLNVNLAAHINPAGFVDMSGNQPQNARFHEYKSTGAGASASSRSSYQLGDSDAAKYTLANILAGWTPSYSQ